MRPLILLGFLSAAFAADRMTLPKYNGERLIKPEGYRQWMFVGANYGMGYTEGDGTAKANPTFHNIYIQREAYERFARTGTFPDKTMLVMEVQKPGTNASINKQGVFQESFVGFEVALKDEKRFDGKWAYFAFLGKDGKIPAEATAFPKDRCWACHNQHAAVDNVFVQFYPVLRDVRK